MAETQTISNDSPISERGVERDPALSPGESKILQRVHADLQRGDITQKQYDERVANITGAAHQRDSKK